MSKRITVTEPEYFAFNFIGNNEGKGIPLPLPKTVLTLCQKGLVRKGMAKGGDKQSCFLTPLGKACFKPKERSV